MMSLQTADWPSAEDSQNNKQLQLQEITKFHIRHASTE
jgi:hypothetical protein